MDSLEDKILKSYAELKQINKVQAKLHLGWQIISKVLHAHGINPRKKGKRKNKRFYNCLTKWVYEHPGQELPRKPRQIEKLTGCSSDSIRTFLYRRRREFRKKVKQLKKLNPLKVKKIFKDIDNHTLSYSMVESYSIYKVDELNRQVLLKLKLKAIKNKNYFVLLKIGDNNDIKDW